jgi:hypothetical protein
MSRRIVLAWAWTALMVALILMPRQWLRHRETGSHAGIHIPHLDKAVHGGLFAVFGVVWMGTGRNPRRLGWIVCAGLFLAVATEMLQGLPAIERDPDAFDGLADLVGVGLGILAFRLRETRLAPLLPVQPAGTTSGS